MGMRSLYRVYLSILFSSCAPQRQDSFSLWKDPKAGAFALIEAKKPLFAPVHSIRLDEASFKVQGLRVAKRRYLDYSTPVLSWKLPPKADYVQILRCPSRTIIHGGGHFIDYVELGASSADEETRVYQHNNFWEAALGSSGCLLIADGLSDEIFEDSFAETGSYHYYARACVHPKRLLGVKYFSTANCSRQVTRSPLYEHVNKRSLEERKKLSKLWSIRNSIDSLGRAILEKTSDLNKSLYLCQKIYFPWPGLKYASMTLKLSSSFSD